MPILFMQRGLQQNPKVTIFVNSTQGSCDGAILCFQGVTSLAAREWYQWDAWDTLDPGLRAATRSRAASSPTAAVRFRQRRVRAGRV